MPKDALEVFAAAVAEADETYGDEPWGRPSMPYAHHLTQAGFAALGANGYVVVPRDALNRFMAQANSMAVRSQEGTYAKRQYDRARAAVVEAVGPTREDKERECICPPATFTTVEEHGYASASSSTRYGCPKHTYEARNEAVGPTT